MKSVTSFDEDIDATHIGSNGPLDLQHALAALGESWANGAAEDFAVSFVTPINALYGNLLAVWPKEAAPEESLVLLSRDIETHLRRYAQENKTEYFGLSLATNGDEPSSIPYSWLYDLRHGSKIMLMPSDIPSLAQGLWLGYTPLEASEIEKYQELEREQQKEAVSDQALDRLDLWQRQFVHMLNTAMADMAQNGFASMSGILRTISTLLKQGQSLAKAIAQGRGQTIERRLEGGEIKTETDKMRQAILSQLADTSLPETIRAALRQQLKSLNEATKNQNAPLNAVRAATKTGLISKGENIVSLTAFAAAFKALSTDRRPAESRLLSTPAALAMRGSVTAINTNAETVREILAFLSDKNQPKDVRATIAALLESGKPITVSSIISALANNGHAAAISSVITALADKGQMAGVKMVTVALAETGQQGVINAVVTTLAGNNQQLTAQTIAVLAEYRPQVAALAVASLTETHSPTTTQAVMNALAAANPQATIQIVAALAEAKHSPALSTVVSTLVESHQQIKAHIFSTPTPESLKTVSINDNGSTGTRGTIATIQPGALQSAQSEKTFTGTQIAQDGTGSSTGLTGTDAIASGGVASVKGSIPTENEAKVTGDNHRIVIGTADNGKDTQTGATHGQTGISSLTFDNAVEANGRTQKNGGAEVTREVGTASDGKAIGGHGPQDLRSEQKQLDRFERTLDRTSDLTDKIKTLIENTNVHVTEVFKVAALEFAERGVVIGQTFATTAEQIGTFAKSTASTVSKVFQDAAKMVCTGGPGCVYCGAMAMVKKIFGFGIKSPGLK